MGFKNLLVFTALLLILKICKVHGNCARVEYINQPYPSSSVATTVSSAPQLVVPAIIKPTISPYDSYVQEPVPSIPSFNGYPNFAPSYPTPMPPIIIEDDDDDNWHHLLYFLIFAMRNRRNYGSGYCGGNGGGYNNNCGCGGGCNGGCGGGYNGGFGGYNSGYGSGCGCGGGCSGSCGGGYDNFGYGGGYNNYGSNMPFIPYPIPIPFTGACPYSYPSFGGYADTSCGCTDDVYQPGQGQNDINVYIRTDQGCSCSPY